MLDAGIDVNRKGGKFGTALTAASHCGSTSVVKVLLEYGADPDIHGCWKDDNALQAACEMENADIVILLLEHGADPNLHGGLYGSALHAAFSKGNTAIINVLLTRGADITYKWGDYGSILQAAVDSGNEAAVEIALGCGLSANEKGGWFTYPLLRATAVTTCPDSIVRLLLKEGADPNLEREGDDFIDQTFRTALQHSSSLSKTNLLLDHGAYVNTVSGWLGTALHAAIDYGGDHRSSMIKLLVHRGANVNQKVKNIGSPLLYAAQRANIDSARPLIEAGADLDSVDIGGHSALHLAISNAEAGEELFDYLVGLGADPLLLDRRGCNGLHYAARASNPHALEKILERGPDVNSIDGYGWTSLHWAAASLRESKQVIQALLDKGCNKHIKDKGGRTALDLATQLGNTKAITILNDTGKAYIDLSEINAAKAEKPVYYYCEGCLIVRNLFRGYWSHTEIFYHRGLIFVGPKAGTNARTVTAFTISAFDVLWIRIFYTPAAIPGPVDHLPLSKFLRGLTNVELLDARN